MSQQRIKEIERLPVAERVERAREKARALSQFVTALIQTHANNRELVYSRRLSEMVGTSFAAHALNDIQKSSFGMELTRLCALWDSPSLDRISLPTVAFLIANVEVLETLRGDHAAGWEGPAGLHFDNEDELSAEDVEYFRRLFRQRNADFAEKNFRRNLRLSLAGVRAVSLSSRLRTVFNHRDRFIAHNLEATSLGRAGSAFAPPRYGYERKLLMTTQRLSNALNVIIHNSSFVYSASREFAAKNSGSLFNAIRIEGAR